MSGSVSRDCRSNPKVCRAFEDGLAKVSRHAHGQLRGLGGEFLQSLRGIADAGEGRPRLVTQRSDGHESAQSKTARVEHRLCERLDVCTLHTAPSRVTREVELDEDVNARIVARAIACSVTECMNERCAIHRVDDRRIVENRLGFFALQLPHEVPAQIEVGELGRFRRSVLMPVFAEIAHPEHRKLAHEFRGVKLCDDDGRDARRIATGVARSIRH